MSKEKNKEIDLGVSLYDVNKNLMAKESPLEPDVIKEKITKMANVIATKEYWMLLNHERRDYSIFKIEYPENIVEELTITLTNRGSILSIEKQEDGSYEIWIRDYLTKENFAYYLFDYTAGIIIV